METIVVSSYFMGSFREKNQVLKMGYLRKFQNTYNINGKSSDKYYRKWNQ
jgi:hypothetical protein